MTQKSHQTHHSSLSTHHFPLFTRYFLLIVLAGFAARMIFAALAPHPGVSDSNHYYNLARNLADGRGFTIDYLWQYHNPPDTVTHPTDYWMPLPAVWPAIGLRLFGDSLFAALIPSVIFGSLLAVLAYFIAAVACVEKPLRLMSMAGAVFLPEFVLNSARTDTTISYILFAGAAMLCFYSGLRGRPRLPLLAGIFAGLTQLSRQDGMILAPAMLLALIVFWRYGEHPIPWRWVLAIPIGWLGIMSPWFIRNYQLFGLILPSGAGRTLFMTSFIDQFTYGRELDLQHYLDWGIPNILSNYAVQALANVKTSYTLLDVGLPVTALIGLGGMAWKREREKLLLLVLPLLMTLGLFVFYSFVTPFHTQGGSFKKSYMLVIPFLSFTGAWALWTFVQPRHVAYIAATLIAGFMLLNAVELIRADFDLARRFDDSIVTLSELLDEVGDQNGDGEITVMTQDPFILAYHGYPALMIPSDPRDMILEAAYRYNVDYILLPADREALDSLYNGEESDPRLLPVGEVIGYELLAVIAPR